MPRTKASRIKTQKHADAEKLKNALKVSEADLLRELDELQEEMEKKMEQNNLSCKLKLPVEYFDKTLQEYIEYLNRTHDGSGLTNFTMNSTGSQTRQLRRSSSFVDEGYRTTESSNTSGGRQSRARAKPLTNSRVSRSLSRNTSAKPRRFITPANRRAPPTYGIITPKVKPNTPLTMMRRPKQGEIAVSLQGSPLLTNTIFSDNKANVNIPMVDGSMLTIQPHIGLRVSDVPNFDRNTLQQLRALRDNLNKVCGKAFK